MLIPLLLGVLVFAESSAVTQVKIHTDQVGGHVVGTYVGATLDQGGIRDWGSELTNSHLIYAAKAVPGVVVRIGGTESDWTYFNTSTAHDQHQELTTKEVDVLCNFVRNANWKMVFAFNALARKQDNDPWDPTNAKSLLNYFAHIKCFDVIAGFELGNEPDLYPRHNHTVTPERMAQDFVILRGVLDSMNIPKESAHIWGPDVAGNHNYFASFLNELRHLNKLDVLNAATFHQYYFSGKGSHPDDYVNPKKLDELGRTDNQFRDVIPKDATFDLVLGETGPSYGGGLKGVTAGYGVTMMWLDKLGTGGRTTLRRVQRQAFWGGNYGLMNRTNTAAPDYYIWNIYRNQTTSTTNTGTVLVVDGDTAKERKLRVYARCTSKESVLVTLINVDTQPTTVKITPEGTGGMEVWAFTSGCDTNPLVCQLMKVNGKLALSGPAGEIPNFPPQRMASGSALKLGPRTSALVLLHGVLAPAC